MQLKSKGCPQIPLIDREATGQFGWHISSWELKHETYRGKVAFDLHIGCGSVGGVRCLRPSTSSGSRSERRSASASGASGYSSSFTGAGLCLDRRKLGLGARRTMGMGTRSLGPASACWRSLGAASLRISQWPPRLGSRRLALSHSKIIFAASVCPGPLPG